MVGLAISSKYNGISLVLAPALIFLAVEWKRLFKDLLRTAETVLISVALMAAGYGIGTPRAILWPAWYFKRMIPAFLNSNTYDLVPDQTIGVFGQWGTLAEVLGWPLLVLFVLALVYALARLIADRTKSVKDARWVVLAVILAVDLPLLVSYLRRPRYFLALAPLIAILVALCLQEGNSAGSRAEPKPFEAHPAMGGGWVGFGAGLFRFAGGQHRAAVLPRCAPARGGICQYAASRQFNRIHSIPSSNRPQAVQSGKTLPDPLL